MAIKKTSKEDILKNSIQLFKTNGYYNTSMANIAEACGLIKGSIYHHFKSKEEIGLESLKYIHKYFRNNIYDIAYDDSLSNKEKIELMIHRTNKYFANSDGGCLLGNLALEVSSQNSIFKDEIREYFTNWEKALTHVLENNHSKEKAQVLAKEYLALTQGEIMMMNLYDTSKSSLKGGEKIITLVE